MNFKDKIDKIKRTAKAWVAFAGAVLTAGATAIVTVPDEAVPAWVKVGIPVALAAVTWLSTYLTKNGDKVAVTTDEPAEVGHYTGD